MKTHTRFGLAVAIVAMIAAPAAFAQDNAAPGQTMPGQGMNGDMMGGDMPGMEGMQGMMQMMQMMGPMMEACTEMMQQMAHHQPGHPDGATPPAGQDAAPAPQGG